MAVPVDLTFGYFADFPILHRILLNLMTINQYVLITWAEKVEAIWENMSPP